MMIPRDFINDSLSNPAESSLCGEFGSDHGGDVAIDVFGPRGGFQGFVQAVGEEEQEATRRVEFNAPIHLGLCDDRAAHCWAETDKNY